jgi:hypothetical protein
MNIQKYLIKHSEVELKDLGVNGRFELRKNASENEDLDTLLDVATYRFANGSVAIYIDLLPELAFLYGKAKRLIELKALFKEFTFALIGVPQSCIEKTNNMFTIGYTFPYLNESQLNYLEKLWCDSCSFEWMDIIMYDSYLLPRKLNRFDKSQLEIVNTEFSDDFLYEIYNLFDEEKDEFHLPCYDRKTNSIIRKDYADVGRGEFIIDYSEKYNKVNKHLTEEYGMECADFFANLFMKDFSFDDIEEFKLCNYVIVPPSLFIEKAHLYFKDSKDIENLKKWFALDFLQKCNQLS